MALQYVLCWLIVLMAAAYLGWRFVRYFRGRTGCSGGCGCAATKPESAAQDLIPSEKLTIRRRSS